MNSHSRRVAAVALALALSIPTLAFARPETGERAFERPGRIGQVIQKIRKILGISANSDLLTPPNPKS